MIARARTRLRVEVRDSGERRHNAPWFDRIRRQGSVVKEVRGGPFHQWIEPRLLAAFVSRCSAQREQLRWQVGGEGGDDVGGWGEFEQRG